MRQAHTEYVASLLSGGKTEKEIDTEMADIAGMECLSPSLR